MYFAQIIANSIVLGTQVLLLAIPLYLIYAVSRVIHLALGATAAAVAYAVYFGVSHGWIVGYSVGLGCIVAVLLGWISYRAIEPFARARQPLFGLITGFSLGVAIESIISAVFGTDGKNFLERILPTISVAGIHIPIPGAITIGVGVVLAILALVVMKRTPTGRLIRSISENPSAIESMGANQSKVRLFVFLAASCIAGFIGVMTGLNASLTPLMGFNLIGMAFIALLVGGVTDIWGTVVASYFISIVPPLIVGSSWGAHTVSSSWSMVIVFIIAVIALSLKPEGLFSIATRKQ